MNPFDWLRRVRRRDSELREELEFHLDAETRDRADSGLPATEAKLAARRDLGNPALLYEETRRVWSWTTLEQTRADLRYAVRTMAGNKAFTALAATALALGIGANTAIYSFVESILLRPLPVHNPDSLVVMKWRAREHASTARSITFSTGGTHADPNGGRIGSVFPYPALELFRAGNRVLASAFCYYVVDSLSVSAGGQTESISGQYISGDYFRGIGVAPAAGRLILPEDDAAGAHPVVVLSHRLATRYFGEPAGAVGRTVRINAAGFTVVGVAPSGFFGAEPAAAPDLYVPLYSTLVMDQAAGLSGGAGKFLDRNYYWIEIMGRLKPGVSLVEAQSALSPTFSAFALDSASNDRDRSDLPQLALLEGATGLDTLRFRYSKPLFVLMGMAGLILLIACANVANLLLARSSARRREMAVRLSMGAGRLRILRQLLTESVLLASLGGAFGVLFAFWGIRFITLLLASGRENFTLRAELNWHVLAVTLALSILTGILFGLAPALQATRVDLMPALKDTHSDSFGQRIRLFRTRIGLGRMLVAAQIALSLVLLVAAALLGRTLSNLRAIEVGFNRENVLLFTIRPRAVGYQGPALTRLYTDLRERLAGIPGVRSASFSDRPLPAGGGTKAPVTVSGAAPPQQAPGSRIRPDLAGLFNVGPDFFATMQIPLLAGREFDAREGTGAALVNRRFAQVFGLDNPVGRAVMLGSTRYEIVGLVGDALFLNLKDALEPIVYRPSLSAQPPGQLVFELRAAGDPLSHAATIREMVRQMDSRLAVSDMKTQAAHIDEKIHQEITLARLCTMFAGLALIIACVGLYGTVAYNVARRTREIGLRMALGAPRGDVLRLVLSEVLVLGLAGVAAGVPAAIVASRYTESLLFGVKPNDPLSVAVPTGILLAAAVVAGLIPAQRASRIDPLAALRHE